ncbi:MFS transporter [Arenibacter algicola]|uniref:Major facilitator superfamily protein n=1 Tax=Arenibacter algicola TaxID=616991 RepID=A0A221US16_9FLAO|nr:MFS transporter [Arenibacter algicola]ASO04137.1 major facilitator superfamily protein [Arenibacter algicola]|tara:strand:- start:931 stop:2172 length:1242 start_codon:yes stop_codon:yes gene_type:complete
MGVVAKIGIKDFSRSAKILILTNLVYAFVMPVIDIFVASYIMRNSNDPSKVMLYQLAIYTGIPITFYINGYLLNRVNIKRLFSLGMLLSGVSMVFMMSLKEISYSGLVSAGLIMGMSFGLYWSNRDYLVLATTSDRTRNFYYGLDTFFYTTTAVLVPIVIGWYLMTGNGSTNEGVNSGYKVVTVAVFIFTIIASIIFHFGTYEKPKNEKFLYFKFHKLWNKMLQMALLKGLAQGFIVTAPAILMMKFFASEGALGTAQSIGAIIAAIIMLILGKLSKPKHRLIIFSFGLICFFLASLFNALLFSSIGVIIFIFLLLIARPILDIAYFPIQLKVIDLLSELENRNEFAYILNHEFGLYVGRLIGAGTFLGIAFFGDADIALRYALLIIGTLQLLAIVIAKQLLTQQNKLENENI